MKRYAWIMAVCLTAVMVSGCGDQKGQMENPGSTSESTTASSDAEAEKEKGASAVKLSEGEVYRDDFDWDGEEEEFSFTFEGDGKDNHNLELYAYTMQMTCDELKYEKELHCGYEETWMIRSAKGDHYLYQESYSEDAMYSVTVFNVTSDEIVEIGEVEGRIGDDGIKDVNAFQWVNRVNMLGTYSGYRTVGVGADGLPEVKEEAYTIGWMTNPLVIKEGITLKAEVFNDNGEPENIVLTAGTELTPKKTDGATYVDAELSDGTMCRITVETEEGYLHTIDGIDEFEYFESIPYAG